VRSLRARLALASGVGVFAVLSAVCSLLFVTYTGSIRAQTDGTLVHAAEQASSIVQALKQGAERARATASNGTADGRVDPAGKAPALDLSEPVEVAGSQLQIVPAPTPGGAPGTLEEITARDVAVGQGESEPYFRTTQGSDPVRVYTTRLSRTDDGVLVRAWRSSSADDAALVRAAALLVALTLAGTAVAAGAGRLGAGRVLRPVAALTAAAERVARSRDPAARVQPPSPAGRGSGPARAADDEVGRLARAFDTMLAELEQSVGAQRQLVADASHELRTPLTSITTNLDLLADGAGVADPQAPRLVQEAREQARELAVLIDDVVDLARVGRVEPHLADVRLDLLVGAVLQRSGARTARGVRWETRLRPCLVRADPADADRAVGNLVDNAVKWSPDDGVVRVSVADGVCTVSDEGPGIDTADLPHVFERFYRSSAARGLPGSGLGLAIVAQVAESHGGSVTVRSGPDGSTFTLSFPVAP